MEKIMKDINAVNSIVPLGEFKAKAAAYLKALKDEPLIVTQNGHAAAVVLSPASFEELRERNRLLESMALGIADVEAGRVVDHADVKTWLLSWGKTNETDPPQCR